MHNRWFTKLICRNLFIAEISHMHRNIYMKVFTIRKNCKLLRSCFCNILYNRCALIKKKKTFLDQYLHYLLFLLILNIIKMPIQILWIWGCEIVWFNQLFSIFLDIINLFINLKYFCPYFCLFKCQVTSIIAATTVFPVVSCYIYSYSLVIHLPFIYVAPILLFNLYLTKSIKISASEIEPS